MKYDILTSFNDYYWEEVANQTVKKLDENWYSTGNIHLYHQLNKEKVEKLKPMFSSRVHWYDLYETVPELPQFIEKFKDHPKANGNGKGEWRIHAIKWVHKTFPLLRHMQSNPNGWLFWLDSDAECFKKIDNSFLKTICNEKKIVSYLGRKGNYSECGFMGYNLNHPETHKFINMWWNIYPAGDFAKISETHDSYIFDAMRSQFGKPDLFDDLNSHSNSNKNPFGNSKIGSHFLHAKGNNKKATLQKMTRRR